ncbi:MAG TPA: patatin-like phospholipase family protein [Candidatus Saccharimonadales bacterium]|nr:patatin-like phospholipase family protein [Candidatus Saccharimonadales bacterium]
MAPRSFSVGVAMGGGAARGLAHIGVLKALQDQGVPIDIVAGTSIGALVGGAFAILKDARRVEERFRRFVHSREFRRTEFEFLKDSRRNAPNVSYSLGNLVKRGIFYSMSMARPSFISEENFRHNIYSLIEDVTFESLGLPFGAVAVDIESGEAVLLRTGSLRKAICASSAIPGMMPPVPVNGRTYIDGGWVSKIPVIEAFKMGADVVIASDISVDLEDTRNLKRGLDVLIRADAIKADALRSFLCRLADVVVRPRVSQVHWADFVEGVNLIEEGERAARARIPDILALMDRGRWRTRLGLSGGKRLARAFF